MFCLERFRCLVFIFPALSLLSLLSIPLFLKSPFSGSVCSSDVNNSESRFDLVLKYAWRILDGLYFLKI